jgi:hypothetical protein
MPTTPQQTQLAIILVEMILTRGIPVALQAIATLKSDEPTLKEIRALRGAIKDPASFFANDDLTLAAHD